MRGCFIGLAAIALACIGCANTHEGDGDAGADVDASAHALDGATVDAVVLDAAATVDAFVPPDANDHDVNDIDAWAYDPTDIVVLEAALRASCTRLVQCASAGIFYSTYQPFCQVDRLPEIEERIRAGYLRVDRAATQTCLDALAGLPTDCHVRLPTNAELPTAVGDLAITAERACEHLFVAETARCDGVECMPHSYCNVDATCAQHCAPLVGIGQACDAVSQCERDLFCTSGVCQPVCTRPYCRAQGFDVCGASGCTDGARLGDTCDGDPPCLDGACVDGRCVAEVGFGEACSTTVPCAVSWVCQAGACRSWYELHLSCYHSYECAPGSYCHDDVVSGGSCDADPVGSPCGPFSQYLFVTPDECPAETICIDARCNVPTADGAPCTSRYECRNGSSCVEGTCTPIVMPWEPCGEGAICPPPFVCDAGRCTRLDACVP